MKKNLALILGIFVIGMTASVLAGDPTSISNTDSHTSITFKLFDRSFTLENDQYTQISVDHGQVVVEFTHRIPVVALSKKLIVALLLNPIQKTIPII